MTILVSSTPDVGIAFREILSSQNQVTPLHASLAHWQLSNTGLHKQHKKKESWERQPGKPRDAK